MTKTPKKMTKYLEKNDDLGLRQVRVLIPVEDEQKVVAFADSVRLDYLNKIANTAPADDPRLHALARGQLSTGIKATQIMAWRQEINESQRILFDRKVLTMQNEWSKMVMSIQSKQSAIMRGDEDGEIRHGAQASVAALSFRFAKTDLINYVAACGVNI